MRMTGVALAALALWSAGVRAEDPTPPVAPSSGEVSSDSGAEVGGFFGLFGRARSTAEPEPVPPGEVAPESVGETKPGGPEPTPTPAIPEEAPAASPAVSPAPEEAATPRATQPPEPVDEPEKPAPEETPAPPPPNLDLGAITHPRSQGRGEREIELPSQEILGEIEKPDIFFLLPRARDRSDEQMIRSRIHREITRPLIKDWLEEELLLK